MVEKLLEPAENDDVNCYLQQIGVGGLICKVANIDQNNSSITNESTPKICFNCDVGKIFRKVGCEAISPKIAIFKSYESYTIGKLFCKIRKRDTSLEFCLNCNIPKSETHNKIVKDNAINRESLNDVVKYYIENDDYETAKNYIKSWGEHIENFNIEEELNKLDEEQINLDFWYLIQGDIIKVSKKLFENGHYSDSVLAAFKQVNLSVKDIIKNITGDEFDGRTLMFKAFDDKNPLIIFDDLSTDTGRNIQEGYKFIFGGSMQAIRNPKAHENKSITKREAIHSIFFASQLMHRLDSSKYDI